MLSSGDITDGSQKRDVSKRASKPLTSTSKPAKKRKRKKK